MNKQLSKTLNQYQNDELQSVKMFIFCWRIIIKIKIHSAFDTIIKYKPHLSTVLSLKYQPWNYIMNWWIKINLFRWENIQKNLKTFISQHKTNIIDDFIIFALVRLLFNND